MPEVGDRVRVESTKLGQAVREGVVTGVVGRLLRIEWSTGEESTFMPGPGSVRVVGKARVRASKKAPGGKAATRATEADKAPGKKAVTKAPSKKAAGRKK